MSMAAKNALIEKENTLSIEQDKVVRLGFRVKDQHSGELLQYGEDLVYLHGGYGGAFPKVEQAMEGCRVGDRLDLCLSPEESYGQRNPSLVLVLPRDKLPEEGMEAGLSIEGTLPNGQAMLFTIADVAEDSVTLDANHPFAGKNLAFRFEVLEIRESIEAERSAGFAFDGMMD